MQAAAARRRRRRARGGSGLRREVELELLAGREVEERAAGFFHRGTQLLGGAAELVGPVVQQVKVVLGFHHELPVVASVFRGCLSNRGHMREKMPSRRARCHSAPAMCKETRAPSM